MSSTSKALLLLVAGAGGANSLSPMASRPGLAFQGGFAGAAGHGGVLSRRTVPGSAGHRTLLEAKTLRQEGRRAAGGARMMAAPAAAASTGIVKAAVSAMTKTPDALFQSIFVALGATAVLMKLLDRDWSKATKEKEEPAPAGVRSLQARFLIVFWLMRMADWLQGPYFYDVYASKVIGGAKVSLDMVSKLFLIGFGTTGLLGPSIGRIVDSKGRKAGTLAFALLYTIGALSVRSTTLSVLMLGRLAGGIGTSLLFSAPESWLVGEHIKGGYDGKWLGQTFGWAYAGDSFVAIAAGQLAGLAALSRGPAGPFEISVVFLLAGALIAVANWKENVAPSESKDGPTISEAVGVMVKDRKIMLVGAVQAMFEGAMYIFVLQWPPSLINVVSGTVPFGKVFSCFMASCLIGSTLFSSLIKRGVSIELMTSGMLVSAASSMAVATACGSSMAAVLAGFFVFEACVGMYFPSIGTLRSKHVPDSHRSVIINLFGVPLNLIVVTVFLSIKKLGVSGALACSTAALSVAAASSIALAIAVRGEASEEKESTEGA